eukprot:scaffold264_cov317-Pinguiococcus_pyrenoidosus.AAC.40
MYRAALGVVCLSLWLRPLRSLAPYRIAAARRDFRLQSVNQPIDNGVEPPLDKLTVVELRQRLKALGGQPKNLRKKELISAIEEKGPVNLAGDNHVEISAKTMDFQKLRVQPLASEPAQRAEGTPEKGVDRSKFIRNLPNTDWSLVFLGTASCVPSLSRFTQSVALEMPGSTYIFDAGEGIQMQIQRVDFRPRTIKKIFITHAHGDHVLGLVGVLCFMGQAGVRDPPVEVYGPEGLRAYLRAALQLTYSRITRAYVVHELKGVPMPLRAPRYVPTEKKIKIAPDKRFGELPGGRDIFPDERGIFYLGEDEDRTLWAAPMAHTVPTVGYVIREAERPGRLKSDVVLPLVQKHKDDLAKATGRDPFREVRVIKDLQPGQAYTFPDGSKISYSDAVEAPTRGRRVVICGDTADASLLAPLLVDGLRPLQDTTGRRPSQDAKGLRLVPRQASSRPSCDILIHEATNCQMPWDMNMAEAAFEADTKRKGHSTPAMTGRTAKAFGARRLLLTHFSPRYAGSSSVNNVNVMAYIEEQARRTSGLAGNRVLASYDMMRIPVLPEDLDKTVGDGEELIFQSRFQALDKNDTLSAFEDIGDFE